MNSDGNIEDDNDNSQFILSNKNIDKKFLEEKIIEKNAKIKETDKIEKTGKIYSIKNFVIKSTIFIMIIIIIFESFAIKKNKNPVNIEDTENSKIVKDSNKSDDINQSDKFDNTDKNVKSDTTTETITDTITDISEDILDNQNLNLYICTHKDFPDKINKRNYYKILCDRTNQLKNKYSLEIIPTEKDNELYPKNLGYSECSKIYYIWKKYKSGNISSEYVGFNHYKRVFNFKNNVPNLTEIFNQYDVILHSEFNLGKTMKQQYSNVHLGKFLDEVLEIIKLNFTEYYQTALNSMKRTKMNTCNIFIMKKEYFLIYGEFLFGVLMEFDRRHNLNTDEDIKNFVLQEFKKQGKKNININYQRRAEGFLAERISQIFYDYHFKKPLMMGVTNLN